MLKNMDLTFALFLCLSAGVFGDTGEVKTVSVMEGDSVTLHTDTHIQTDDHILWMFGPQETHIAEIYGQNLIIKNDGVDEKFRVSLKLDNQTGSLTIRNIITKHSGLYKLQITSRKTTYKRFNVSVCGDIRAETAIQVMEGDSVTLHIGLAKIKKDDNIIWTFGDTFLVNMYKGFHIMSSFDGADGRFINRLWLDSQTGSLTIRNVTTKHSGIYWLIHNNSSSKMSVTVYTHLPVPVITRDSPQNSSSSSTCVLLCSVMNVTHVTLSWYKGNSLFSSISASDLNISLSLPLVVEYQDTNTYSCVLNNPIRNQTQHLHITAVCQLCSDYVQCFSFTEAVIRLVISALVGVATVAVVVYDIRSRRVVQKLRDRTSHSDPD